MSKTIDISVENNGTEVIIVSLERVGVEARVGNVERSITVDFGSLPQNIYWDEILDKPNFHPVATSGDYDDLENKPNLHQVATTGDYQDLENKPNLSEVATSGDYGDLTGKPRINNVTLDGNKSAANLGLATAAQGAKADTAYQKPVGGIPGSDMSAAVQSALEKAETALQEHQSLEGYATEAWVEDQGYLTEHQDISGKADKSDTYTKQEVDAKMASAMHYKGSVANYDALLLIQDAEVGDMYNVLDTGHNYAWDGAAWDIQSGIVDLSGKQDTLVSGENIKTINGESILGSGNIVIQGGGGGTGDYEELDNLPSINNVKLIGNKTAAQLGLQTELTIDATPTEDSTNPVQSGGVYEALVGTLTKISVEGIDNLTAAELASLEGGDVVLDIIPRIPKAYIVMSAEAGTTILVNINTVGIEVVSYSSDAYQSTETLTYDSIVKKPTRWNGGLLLTYNQDGNIAESGIDEADVATTSDLAGKQDTISDLATIRSGAAAGATAYQKPSGGIPKTDLASGVQTSLGKADTAFQKPSGGIPASDLASGVIPNSVVNATSQQDGTIVLTMVNGDTITIDLNHQHPNYYSKVAETTQPSGGMLPDVTYKLGTLTGATTFTFAAAVSGNVNHYYFTFTSGTTAVVPTWPASITAWDGNCVDSTTHLPVIAASKTYEVSVIDGLAMIKEW